MSEITEDGIIAVNNAIHVLTILNKDNEAIRAMKFLLDHYHATKDQQWISVDDRLPEDDRRVLVHWVNTQFLMNGSDIMRYREGKWIHGGSEFIKITDWQEIMPLPPKPEGE